MTDEAEFGTHGYDNANQNMKPYFLAYGPKIKKNYVVAPFNTVDLLSLFCAILEISIPANNGSFVNIADILVIQNGEYGATTKTAG